MKKLALLFAAGTLWLFLAAIPAFADGGPHVASINNGTTSLTADTCAQCHRVHTAKGPYLLQEENQEALCFSCHGAASPGATTDVVTGVQYEPQSNPDWRAMDNQNITAVASNAITIVGHGYVNGETVWIQGLPGVQDGQYEVANTTTDTFTLEREGDPVTVPAGSWTANWPTAGIADSGTILGALRGGGFEEARIGDPFRFQTGSSRYGKVQVASAAEPVNSAHMPGLAGLVQPGKAWGNGANGTGVGPSATLECGACHNPHGNGMYRILNTIPGATGIDATWGGGRIVPLLNVVGYGTDTGNAAADYNTSGNHGLNNNARIVVKGNALTAANVTGYVIVVDTDTFNVKTSLTGTALKFAAATTAGGTVTVPGVQIFDYANGVYTSVSSMGVINGDSITVYGNTLAGANATGTITMVDGPDSGTTPDDNRFTLSGVTSVTVPGTGTGGQAIRNLGTKVTDHTNPSNATRNYTVIQDYTPVTVVSYDGASKVYTTSAAHGFAVGDTVSVGGNVKSDGTLNTDSNTTSKVLAVGSTTTFTLTGVTNTANGTGGTAIGNNKVLLASQALPYDETDGDYFHYRVPWNTANGASLLDAPNGVPGGSANSLLFNGGFGEQMAAWCASCHSRYWAWSEPTEDPTDGGATGPSYSNARPGDSVYMYQHRTRGASGRGCLTCHVSHGSNAQMTGTFSSTFTFPNGTPSNNSRLLKVDDRGTCQQCHEPTGTGVTGDQYPTAAPTQRVNILSSEADTDTFTTVAAHGLSVGDQVSIANHVLSTTPSTTTVNSQFIVATAGTDTFTVYPFNSTTTFDIVADGLVETDGANGTVGKLPATP